MKLRLLLVWVVITGHQLCLSGQWEISEEEIATTGEKVKISAPFPKLTFESVQGNLPFFGGSIAGGLGGLYFESPTNFSYESSTGVNFLIDGLIQTAMNSQGNWGFGVNSPEKKIHLKGDFRFEESGRIEWYNGNARKAFVFYDGNDLFVTNEDDDSAPAGDIVINAKDDLQIVNNNNFSITIDEQNRVGIGTTSPSYQLDIMGDIGFTGELTAASDRRLKTNIKPIKNAMDLILQLNPVSYNFRTSEFPELRLPEELKCGLIAQEVEEVLPLLVSSFHVYKSTSQNVIDMKSVNYIELVPLLIQAIKEIESDLQAKEEEINRLKKEMSHLVSQKNLN